MEDSNRLNAAKKCCEKLLNLCAEENNTRLEISDDFGFMALCFLSKQKDHMGAVLKLFPHPDMKLISRAMMEGSSQLIWCSNHREMASKWRKYSWIDDWRLSRDRAKIGQPAPSEIISAIKEFIDSEGYLFSIGGKPVLYEKIPEDKDPFYKNWRCGAILKNIIEEVGDKEEYEKVYSPYSDWQHWGVSSIGAMIKKEGNVYTYNEQPDGGNLSMVLILAFRSLYEVMRINDDHYKLRWKDKLIQLRDDFVDSVPPPAVNS